MSTFDDLKYNQTLLGNARDIQNYLSSNNILSKCAESYTASNPPNQYWTIRYVRINQNVGKYLHLKQIEVVDISGTNIARPSIERPTSTVTAFQSSTYHINNDASKVINGSNDNTNFSQTLNGNNEFIELDLGSELKISSINVHNRANCDDSCKNLLNGAILKLSDTNKVEVARFTLTANFFQRFSITDLQSTICLTKDSGSSKYTLYGDTTSNDLPDGLINDTYTLQNLQSLQEMNPSYFFNVNWGHKDDHDNNMNMYNTMVSKRSNLDKKMQSLYADENNSDTQVMYQSAVFTNLSWTILATSVLYFLFVKL